jgi:hypothetical protein
LDNPNGSEDNCTANDEYDREQTNHFTDWGCQEQQGVSEAPNGHGSVWLTEKSTRQADKVFVTDNVTETRRNKGVKKQYGRMRQLFTSFYA